jgi:hypothetical protein
MTGIEEHRVTKAHVLSYLGKEFFSIRNHCRMVNGIFNGITLMREIDTKV